MTASVEDAKLIKQSYEQKAQTVAMNISHSSINRYILNGASHHAAQYHRLLSNLTFTPPNKNQVQNIVEYSVNQWAAEEARKNPSRGKGKGKAV